MRLNYLHERAKANQLARRLDAAIAGVCGGGAARAAMRNAVVLE